MDSEPGADVIISVLVPTEDAAEETKKRYALLMQILSDGGLKAVGRRGKLDGQILVFVSCPDLVLKSLLQRERELDFLSGLSVPITPAADHALAPAERIRLVHSFITSAPSDSGLGVHPDTWDMIEAIFCLHDHDFNERWVQAWTSNWISAGSISQEQIRAHFGDAISQYFIFIQSYTRALTVPALLGFVFWSFGATYSPVYSLLLSIWAIGFVEWWRVEERRVALRFGVRGAAKVEKARVQNAHREGSPWTREVKMLMSIPIILGFALLLTALMTAIFFLEEFCEHFYMGPGQQYVAFAPTVVYAILVPYLISHFQSRSEHLATWENHPHHSAHDASVTLKTFIFTALVAYLSLTLTALVYVPFGDAMVNAALQWLRRHFHSKFDGSTLLEKKTGLRLDRSRLEEQIFAYTVTNQIVDSTTEIGWPYAMKIWDALLGLVRNKADEPSESHRFFEEDNKFFEDVPTMDSPPGSPSSSFFELPPLPSTPKTPKSPFKKVFSSTLRSFSTLLSYPSKSPHSTLLSHALTESTLPSTPPNLSTDYSEMVIQFGYIVLWSTIFPLAPLCALVNNVFEMRKDAWRIVRHERRPVPLRVETVGPWLDVLGFLGWGSVVVNVVLVGLFCPRSDDSGIAPKCNYLFDLTRDTGTPIEMISQALSDAVWDSKDTAAWRELGMTVLLLALGASQVWFVLRAILRHVIEKVMWEGSREVQGWRKEERRVKEAFLNGLGAEEPLNAQGNGGEAKEGVNIEEKKRKQIKLKTNDREGRKNEVGLRLSHTDVDFWEHDEGLDEIRRLLKEE